MMMKRIVPYLLLVFCISVTYAGYDRVIGPGEYELLPIEWQSGLLLVNGGGADEIGVLNSAQIEVQSSSIPINGNWYTGGIQYLDLYSTSHLDYFDGVTRQLTLRGNATAYFEGGRIDYIRSYQLSNQSKHITMVCDVESVDHTGNLLTGNWLDGSSFSITLQNVSGYDTVYSNIHFIPEPATLLLFGLGGLLLRRRQFR